MMDELIGNIPGMGAVYNKDIQGMKLFTSNKEEILAEVARIGCLNYSPCSVCNKCMNKAWHLYEICSRCNVVTCHHKQKDRAHLIKPKNFTYNKDETLSMSIEKVYNEYKMNQLGGNTDGDEGK